MSFFSSLLSNIFFEKKERIERPEILLKESIKRTKYFMLEYQQWALARMHQGLQDHLSEMRLIRNSNSEANINYYRHSSKLSNGFYFYLEEPWSSNDYNFFVQFVIERLKLLGYVINNSLREAKEIDEELITIEEFYLKPSLKFRRKTPYEQFFGNVHMEIKSKNDNVQLVKIVVNSYSDRNYKDARSFDAFLDFILTSS